MFRRKVRSSITNVIIITLLVMNPVVFAETQESKVTVTTGAWDAAGNFAGDPVAFAQTQEDRVKASTSELVMNPGVLAETRKVTTGAWDAEGNFAGDPVAFTQTEEDRLKATTVDHSQITSAAPVDACDSC